MKHMCIVYETRKSNVEDLSKFVTLLDKRRHALCHLVFRLGSGLTESPAKFCRNLPVTVTSAMA